MSRCCKSIIILKSRSLRKHQYDHQLAEVYFAFQGWSAWLIRDWWFSLCAQYWLTKLTHSMPQNTHTKFRRAVALSTMKWRDDSNDQHSSPQTRHCIIRGALEEQSLETKFAHNTKPNSHTKRYWTRKWATSISVDFHELNDMTITLNGSKHHDMKTGSGEGTWQTPAQQCQNWSPSTKDLNLAKALTNGRNFPQQKDSRCTTLTLETSSFC